MTIAFFDVDKTILAVNSSNGWLRRELKGGFISYPAAARTAFYVALYGFGFAAVEEVMNDLAAKMRGQEEAPLAARSVRYWEEEMQHLVRAKARPTIEKHVERGDRIVLLTAAPNYFTAAVASTVGAVDILCNRMVVEDGRFTGKVVEPLCFGAGKVAHAKEYAAKHDAALEHCTFYTDSYSDLPMMEAVGDPVAVHPDRRLRKVAQERGWRIEDWT